MVYPNMVMKLVPTGLLGVMLAALLSALTSTLSAILNSTSTLFTMDFYAKARSGASSKQLVIVGKVVSCVIVVIAAIWAPQIGRFGSLLKYYQEMLSYIAPPIVATFLLGIFSRRVNGTGAFIGLLAGLLLAVLVLVFKSEIFGDLHFLLIVPFLFLASAAVTYLSSLCFARPSADKLQGTIFSLQDFSHEVAAAYSQPWYSNYLNISLFLVVCCFAILFIFA